MAMTPAQILQRELEGEKRARKAAFEDVDEAALVLDLKRQHAAACESRVSALENAIKAVKEQEQGK